MTGDAATPKPGGLPGHAFICYVREDSARIDRLQQLLEDIGIPVWRDTANLWPGQIWKAEIRRAITDDALVFLACFSRNSTARKRSEQNDELALAIDELRLRRPDVPWLLPIRLDDCEIPDRSIGGGRTLASLESADLFGDRYEQEAAQLVEAVKRILGRRPAAGATRPPATRPAAPRVRTADQDLGRGLGKLARTRTLIVMAIAVIVAAVLTGTSISLDGTAHAPCAGTSPSTGTSRSAGPIVSPSPGIAFTAEAVPSSPGPAPTSVASGSTTLLEGVAAVSARSAWAVGSVSSGGRTVTEYWNGTTWKLVPSPPESSRLRSVAAVSADDAWAVSEYGGGSDPGNLMIHWNGTTWCRVASPAGQLYGVATTTADNAWAVGSGTTAAWPDGKALILHWNGTAWSQVPNPGLGGSWLYGVAATTADNAWAVGCTGCQGSPHGAALTMHWNGTAWTSVPNPSPSQSILYGVAAISADDAWAVGYATINSGAAALVLRWNGRAWTRVPCPNAILSGVAATSAQNAWAVGALGIVHWNGSAWAQVPSPSGALSGITATSAQNAWAVGNDASGRGLILHWNGRTWTQVPSPAV